MSRRAGLLILIMAAGSALLYLQLMRHNPLPEQRASDAMPETGMVAQTRSASKVSAQSQPGSSANEVVARDALATAPRSAPAAPAPAEPVPATSESSSLPPETVLANMRTSIRQFASTFGENPVGTNPEITSALQGDNPKHINFLKPDGNRVNAKGELVDTWGTPYFFHQISGHEMEIRSAGPDRVMYTGDDLVTR